MYSIILENIHENQIRNRHISKLSHIFLTINYRLSYLVTKISTIRDSPAGLSVVTEDGCDKQGALVSHFLLAGLKPFPDGQNISEINPSSQTQKRSHRPSRSARSIFGLPNGHSGSLALQRNACFHIKRYWDIYFFKNRFNNWIPDNERTTKSQHTWHSNEFDIFWLFQSVIFLKVKRAHTQILAYL